MKDILINPLNTEEIEKISDIFVSMTTLLFDQLPIPVNFLDTEGRVIIMNEAFLNFLRLNLEDVIGRHLSEIDPTVRLPIVVKTGRAEIGQKHRFYDGREAIVHRIPIFYKDVIIGGVGIILFDDLGYLHDLTVENHLIKSLKGNKLNRIKDLYQTKYTFDHILTQSDAGKRCKEQAQIYATTDFSVLITGESGVGKELFAHAIHADSKRSKGPFIRVNCAAIPEALIESELFGYGQGAFTGANKGGKMGKFELANGGTIFLDEIGDFPLHLQAKLLRILQEKELEKVGTNEITLLDIRVIAATNCDLEEKVKQNQFRSDLFYRLNVLNLNVPSLRDRQEDVPLLVNHFATLLYQDFNILKVFPQEIMKLLMQYAWPGNIRELKNIVERTAVNAPEETITQKDLPRYILETLPPPAPMVTQVEAKEAPLKESLAALERALIEQALKKHDYNKAQAAKVLGIPRMTLYRKLKAYQLDATSDQR